MSGQLGEAGLADDTVYQVLDLCLECRACKSECPVGVDMATFKSEFLAAYWKKNGIPLKAKSLGRIGAASVWGSRFAPISNWIASATRPLIGVDTRRPLPNWTRQTLEKRLGRRVSSPRAASAAPVTLFNDTFLNHYHPEIGIAAIEILERSGHKVDVVRPGCCGRPLISKGLLGEAQSNAARIVKALLPIVERGEKILFCEPSCLSAIKEDVPALLRGDQQQKARTIASASMIFDEFASKLDLELRPGPSRILLHGHCHQKSLGLLGASSALVSRIPGASVIDLDAGCCGMAGSFGYGKDHYEVSVAIANRRLLPAVKGMKPGDVLVAPGTSCRQQVKDLAGADALHPAVLIRSLLN
jgi:Fe-S oxidoreductase